MAMRRHARQNVEKEVYTATHRGQGKHNYIPKGKK